jgi:NitT/TauT family transport system substrate-binding protein
VALCCGAALGQDRLGEPGGPVELLVGYQPYWPPSWSAVVQRARAPWSRHLPEHSTVEFRVGLRGSVLTQGVAKGELDLVYVGDLPAIAAVSPAESGARIVAVLGTSQDSCSILLVRSDAPPLPDAPSAVRWLEGKNVGLPRGSCAERFAVEALAAAGVSPRSLSDHSILALERSLTSRHIDAAFVWEPSATRLERLGIARRVATGRDFGVADSGFLVASAELIRRRPDALRGWIEAELDAQLFLIDPANRDAMIEMARVQTMRHDREDLLHALYASAPGGPPRSETTFELEPLRAFTAVWEHARRLGLGALSPDVDPATLVHSAPARAALQVRGLATPIGRIAPSGSGR